MKPAMERPLYYDFDGFRLSSAFTIERYRSAIKYEAQPDDVFIATYPKCGTTWLQEICYLIFNDGKSPESHLDRLTNTPFLEMLGAGCIAQMKKPGAVKTHLPFSLIPFSPRAKYVYVVRNPKDCLVSFYYHTSKVYPGYNFTDGKFDEFFELFMNGQTDFGCYFDHVVGWLRQRDKANILFLHFEDVKRQPAVEIQKIGDFLGEPYASGLRTGDLLDRVLEQSSHKNMKKDFGDFKLDSSDASIPDGIRHFALANKTTSDPLVKFGDHVRKGTINDWKSHLTSQMNERIDERIRQRFEAEFPDVIEKWTENGVFEPLPHHGALEEDAQN